MDFCAAAIASLILHAAAFILAIGQQNDGLAARLLAHLLTGSQIDRVVEQGSFGLADGGNGPAAGAGNARRAIASGGVDPGFAHGARQLARIAGVILQQVYVHVEGEQKRLVFGLKHALDELAARILLQGQNAGLTAEVSSRIPSVSGCWVSATKLFNGCGWLSSETEQSPWVR